MSQSDESHRNVNTDGRCIRTLVGRVESVLALVRVDDQPHGHVDGVDKDVGKEQTLPEVVTASSISKVSGQ